jgi:DNA-binding SARP family transcriptional activator
VYAFGEFRLLKDGQPLRFSGKVQRRPIELLKALIAFGPRGVAEERLADTLWPDGESDAAHQAVATTLHRLRALIGPESIVLRGGLLTLNHSRCWVDAWAFMRLLDEAEAVERKGHPEEARVTVERALGLYRAPLLAAHAGEAWLISPRERYRRMFLRHLGGLGRSLEAAGEWRQAVDWYERGLEVDDLAEEFYQRLMACYERLGRWAEGLAAYQRCRTALASGLGVALSPDTEALHRALRERRSSPRD